MLTFKVWVITQVSEHLLSHTLLAQPIKCQFHLNWLIGLCCWVGSISSIFCFSILASASSTKKRKVCLSCWQNIKQLVGFISTQRIYIFILHSIFRYLCSYKWCNSSVESSVPVLSCYNTLTQFEEYPPDDITSEKYMVVFSLVIYIYRIVT